MENIMLRCSAKKELSLVSEARADKIRRVSVTISIAILRRLLKIGDFNIR